MALNAQEVQDFNRTVQQWGATTKAALLQKLSTLGLQDRIRAEGQVSLIRSLGVRFRKADEQIISISFPFARHGIYLELGVGKGVKLADVPRSNRVPKPWISVVLPGETTHLADLLASKFADFADANIRVTGSGNVNLSKKK